MTMARPTFSSGGDLYKLNEEQRMVYGYLTTEEEDAHGDIVTVDALEKAFEDYWGNIREMHEPKAAGVVREHGVDEKGFWIGAYIGDDQAWRKVKDEIYKGFSIRGPCLGRDPMDRRRVTACKLKEISLVDRGANNLRFELVKLDDYEETEVSEKTINVNVDATDLSKLVERAEELCKRLDKIDLEAFAKNVEKAGELVKLLDGDQKPDDEVLSKLADGEKAGEEILEKLAGAAKAGEEILEKLADGRKVTDELVKTVVGYGDRLKKLEDTPRGVEPASGAAASGAVSKSDDSDLTPEQELAKLGDNATAEDYIRLIHSQGGHGPLA